VRAGGKASSPGRGEKKEESSRKTDKKFGKGEEARRKASKNTRNNREVVRGSTRSRKELPAAEKDSSKLLGEELKKRRVRIQSRAHT